jgi:hypothetical protein
MTTPKPFPSALDASSNQSPGGGELYAPLRKNIVETALAKGYDKATMIEIAVSWADDQDPFGHVKNAAYGGFVSACNVRVFHSFEAQLKDHFDDFMNAKHIGCLVSSITTRLMRPVKFPDSVREGSF